MPVILAGFKRVVATSQSHPFRQSRSAAIGGQLYVTGPLPRDSLCDAFHDGSRAPTPRTIARPVAFRASARTGAHKTIPFAVAPDTFPCAATRVTIPGPLAQVAIFPPIRHLVRPRVVNGSRLCGGRWRRRGQKMGGPGRNSRRVVIGRRHTHLTPPLTGDAPTGTAPRSNP